MYRISSLQHPADSQTHASLGKELLVVLFLFVFYFLPWLALGAMVMAYGDSWMSMAVAVALPFVGPIVQGAWVIRSLDAE